MSHFPNNLRAYRLRQGLSQRQLATMLNQPRSRISLWEAGRELPSWDIAKRLMELYEVSLRELYPARWMEEIIVRGCPAGAGRASPTPSATATDVARTSSL